MHSSGEVWAQTLWDLRKRLGHTQPTRSSPAPWSCRRTTRPSSTCATRSSRPTSSSTAAARRNQIWRTFADRGMGWYAGTIDAGDAFPQENFHVAAVSGDARGPRSSARSPTASRVTRSAARWWRSPVTTPASPATTPPSPTPDGTLPDPERVHRHLRAGPGHRTRLRGHRRTAHGRAGRHDRPTSTPRRDWAPQSGGGFVTDFNGPDYSAFGVDRAAPST